MDDLLTTDMAARAIGVSRWAVLKALGRGSLSGVRLGRDYLLTRDEVERYRQERKPTGPRPPKATAAARAHAPSGGG